MKACGVRKCATWMLHKTAVQECRKNALAKVLPYETAQDRIVAPNPTAHPSDRLSTSPETTYSAINHNATHQLST